MQSAKTHQEQSRALLEQAYAKLEAGDLHQASKMGWDAAMEMLRAVAEERGWEHDDVRPLVAVMGKLAVEARNGKLQDGFNAAFMLRTYYGEGWLYGNSVQVYLDRVREFVADTEGLLNGR